MQHQPRKRISRWEKGRRLLVIHSSILPRQEENQQLSNCGSSEAHAFDYRFSLTAAFCWISGWIKRIVLDG
jgi:hypothetical protein